MLYYTFKQESYLSRSLYTLRNLFFARARIFVLFEQHSDEIDLSVSIAEPASPEMPGHAGIRRRSFRDETGVAAVPGEEQRKLLGAFGVQQ